MKRIAVWVLVLAMLCTFGSGLADRSIIILERPNTVMENGIQEGSAINVGMVTAPSGYFATNMWGTNAADLSIRALLHGYSTVVSTRAETNIFDGMVIAAVKSEGEGEIQKKYTISLMVDLTYNDGTPITAKDYIFSLLMSASPLIGELGGVPRDISQFAGHEAYLTGASKGLRGVRLISENTFSLEIDPAYLPYFYGIAMLDITPYPMHVIAPGCDIVDDGDGCYISGEFTKTLLEKTLLDPSSGYLFNPRVTSGPYQFESYDKETGIVSLVINPMYIGNFDGAKPSVERLTLRKADNDTVIDMLSSGEINLATELLSGDAIRNGMALRAADPSLLQVQNYARSGLAYLALTCEKGPASDVAVRKALAQCMDKTSITRAVSPYSMAVDGYYGLGQWMLAYISEGDANGEGALDVMEEVKTLNIPFDVEAAKDTLAAAGWNLDAQGNPYTEGVRYRRGENGLESLTIRWAKNESRTTDLIREIIEPSMVSAGFALSVTEVPFSEVLEYFYRHEDRQDYDMFFLAGDFLQTFDPYYEYNTDDAYQGVINTSGLKDEELMDLAEAMRRTSALEYQLYVERWLAFQRAWVEKMPLIPLYSNMYFDFYAGDIQDYDNVTNLNWGYAMSYVWIGENAEEDGATENDAVGGDDQIVIIE